MNKETIDPSSFGKVAVLMGGLYAEREISLLSGQRVLQGLKNMGVNVIPIDWTKELNLPKQLAELDIDRVFIALHGRGSEDGTVQGLLDIMAIPYTGCGVAASALAMDKLRAKCVWQSLGLPTPKFVVLNENFDAEKVVNLLGLPIFVKPTQEGSSLGITKVNSIEQLKDAFLMAREYSKEVIAEEFIEGAELTVGILDQQALPVIKIETPREFYDYEAKYFTDTTQYLTQTGLTQKQTEEIQNLSLNAYHALGCKDWGRVDFMQDKKGQFYLIELNTIPGMTDHSLVPMAAKEIGIDFDHLVLKILATTLCQ